MTLEFRKVCVARWAMLNEIAFSPRGYGHGGHTGGHDPYVEKEAEGGWTLSNGDQGWCRLTPEEAEVLQLPETPVGGVWSVPFRPPCGLPQGVLIQGIAAERVPPGRAQEGERLTAPGEGEVVSGVSRLCDLSAPRGMSLGLPQRSVWRFRYA